MEEYSFWKNLKSYMLTKAFIAKRIIAALLWIFLEVPLYYHGPRLVDWVCFHFGICLFPIGMYLFITIVLWAIFEDLVFASNNVIMSALAFLEEEDEEDDL